VCVCVRERVCVEPRTFEHLLNSTLPILVSNLGVRSLEYAEVVCFGAIQASSQCICCDNRGNVPSVLVRCSPMPDLD
jgi:hypothetical protein